MRENLHQSPLVSVLSPWVHLDAAASKQDWAARLGAWLGPVDAITLHSAHQSLKTPIAATPRIATPPQGHTIGLTEALQQLRNDLEDAIAAQGAAVATPHYAAKITTEDLEADATYAAYRMRYRELQRRMEWRIEPFRAHCRKVLSETSERLRQLVDLDTALELTVGKREKLLTAKVAVLLEQRFNYLKKAAEHGWLTRFESEFQAALRAELEFRVELVAGLVDAFHHENITSP